MRNNIRLVIADVDGTLVTQDKVLTTRAIEAVKRLRATGIAFTVTSGRPPLGMRMLIDALAITEPVAGLQRCVLVHPDLSVMAQSFVPADTAAKVIAAIARHGLDCWVYTDHDWLVRNPKGPHVDVRMDREVPAYGCAGVHCPSGARGQGCWSWRRLRRRGPV